MALPRSPSAPAVLAALLAFAVAGCGAGTPPDSATGSDHDAGPTTPPEPGLEGAAPGAGAAIDPEGAGGDPTGAVPPSTTDADGGEADGGDALADALARGDAAGVTERELADALYATREALEREGRETREALFGTSHPDPERRVGALDWNPTHDSVVLEAHALAGGVPVLVSNHAFKRDVGGEEILAVAGDADGARWIAFGGNPVHDLAKGSSVGGSANAAMQTLLENGLRWLTRGGAAGAGAEDDASGTGADSGAEAVGDAAAEPFDVVIAHLADGYWARHDGSAHAWLAQTFPAARVNEEDACESAALAGCLVGAELLVIGGEDGTYDSHGVPFELDAALAAFDAARGAGVAVLYLNRGRGGGTLAAALLDRLGLSGSNNYWSQEGLEGYLPDAGESVVPRALDELIASVRTVDEGAVRFDYAATDVCTSHVGRQVCHPARVLDADGVALGERLTDGADALRGRLAAHDRLDRDVFSLDASYRPTQLAVLLADKYREGVTFPMDKLASDPTMFHRSLLADAGVHYARASNPAQSDVGLYAGAQAALHAAAGVEREIERVPTRHAGWTSTGLYVPPGRAVTVTRTDALAVDALVRVHMLRDTTRIWNTNGYSRPRHLTSHAIAVPAASSVTFSTPHGGPLYLYTAAGETDGADPGAVSLRATGVLDNPLLDAFDEASITAFSEALLATDSDWVDVRTPFAEIHSLKAHVLRAFARQDGDESNGYTTTDVIAWVEDLNGYLIKGNYEYAGFSSGSLAELDAPVAAWCVDAGLTAVVYDGETRDLCRDERLHPLPRVQHVNAGIAATCGGLCSGNPFDSGVPVAPLGWGENHEMGHNLQRARLKVHGARSGEVSNNLFPLQTARRWAIERGLERHPSVNRPDHAGAFEILQDAIAADTPPGIDHPLWSGRGTYDNAFERLAFYVQLAYASGGWELWTKLHIAERVLTDAVGEESTWLAARDALGFGSHDLAAARAVDGNDFVYVAASTIDGRDYAALFEAWGVSVSDAARAQVAANGVTERAPATFRFVEGTLPVAIPTAEIPLDGVSAWKAPAE